jgi:hypothetical protein
MRRNRRHWSAAPGFATLFDVTDVNCDSAKWPERALCTGRPQNGDAALVCAQDLRSCERRRPDPYSGAENTSLHRKGIC